MERPSKDAKYKMKLAFAGIKMVRIPKKQLWIKYMCALVLADGLLDTALFAQN